MKNNELPNNIDEIELNPVYGSSYCQYSVIENKLKTLYENQEKLLQAIKLLANIIETKNIN